MSRARCFDTGQQDRTSGDRTILRSGQEIYKNVFTDLATTTWSDTRDIRVNQATQELVSVSSVDLLSRITKGEYDYRQRCEETCFGSSEAAGDAFNKTLTTDIKDATLDLTSATDYNDQTTSTGAPQRMYPFEPSTTTCEEYVYPEYEKVSAGEEPINRKPIYRQPTRIMFV
jgi:hypothetical protein